MVLRLTLEGQNFIPTRKAVNGHFDCQIPNPLSLMINAHVESNVFIVLGYLFKE